MKKDKETLSIVVRLGKSSENIDSLVSKCKEETEIFINKYHLYNKDEFNIVFWTNELKAELICIAHCKRNELDKIEYNIDTTDCTL